jgi:hypothetical protein
MGNQVAERKEVNPTNNQNLTDIWSKPDAFQTAMRMAKAYRHQQSYLKIIKVKKDWEIA